MSFSAEDDNNDNNVQISRDKDLYRNYHLQHSLLARERSLAEQSHKTAIKMLMMKFYPIYPIRFMKNYNN